MDKLMEEIVRNATLAADVVAMEPHPSGVARTRAIVARALEFAVDNGLMVVTDPDGWPRWEAEDYILALRKARVRDREDLRAKVEWLYVRCTDDPWRNEELTDWVRRDAVLALIDGADQ